MVRAYLINRRELGKISYDDSFFSEGRLKKIDNLKHEDDKQLSACVELLLIHALKELDADVKLPLEIEEEESEKLTLKTSVAGFDQIYFNLSHAKDYALCAISDKPVGADIEYVKTKEVAHADRILHPEELLLSGFVSNQEEKKKYFYECWVSKESYLKNLGLGLSVRPASFKVEEDKLVTEESSLLKRYVHVYKADEVEGADWKFDASYRMALCTMKKDPDTKIRILTAGTLNI